MVFQIHSLSVIGLVCCLVDENMLNFTSGLVLLCFFIRFTFWSRSSFCISHDFTFDFWLTSLTFNWMVLKINSLNELRKIVNTVKVKLAKSKETGWSDKARSLSHWEVGYQSSLVFASWQFLDRFLSLLWLAYCFASIWISYWLLQAKGIFLWIYMLL